MKTSLKYFGLVLAGGMLLGLPSIAKADSLNVSLNLGGPAYYHPAPRPVVVHETHYYRPAPRVVYVQPRHYQYEGWRHHQQPRNWAWNHRGWDNRRVASGYGGW